MGRVSAVLFAVSVVLWLGGHYCGYRVGLLFDGKSGLGDLEAARIWMDSQGILLYGGLIVGLSACMWVNRFSRMERVGAALVFGCAYAIVTVMAPWMFQAA
ncbi:hypothetical protein L1281_002319 [Neisseria sp. HSC-16F19]|nr:hypothetical protein [Neisseria sp. HSC-16F19]MCP2041708.1 hypothetical protein [Neisseria sp. HSC-16F19]